MERLETHPVTAARPSPIALRVHYSPDKPLNGPEEGEWPGNGLERTGTIDCEINHEGL